MNHCVHSNLPRLVEPVKMTGHFYWLDQPWSSGSQTRVWVPPKDNKIKLRGCEMINEGGKKTRQSLNKFLFIFLDFSTISSGKYWTM